MKRALRMSYLVAAVGGLGFFAMSVLLLGVWPGRVLEQAFFGSTQQLRIRLEAGWHIVVTAAGREPLWGPDAVVHCTCATDSPLVVGP